MEKVFLLANEQNVDHLVQLVCRQAKSRMLGSCFFFIFSLPTWLQIEVESDGHSHLDDGDGQDFHCT